MTTKAEVDRLKLAYWDAQATEVATVRAARIKAHNAHEEYKAAVKALEENTE
jgi:hypothetical protein